MEQALKDLSAGDTQTRLRGVRRLGLEGGAEAVAALIRLLDDPDVEVAALAANSLGELEAPEALPVLLERLRSHPSGLVRSMCADALGSFEEQVPLDVFVAALRDPEERVISASASVLGWRGDPAAVGPLQELLDDPRWNARYSACQALLHLEVEDPRLKRALEELLLAPEKLGMWQSLDWVEAALQPARSPSDGTDVAGEPEQSEAEVLAKADRDLREGSPAERQKAANQLHHVSSADAIPLLVRALEDPAYTVRRSAATALGIRGAAAGLPGLLHHLLHDEAPQVRKTCATVLDQFPADEVIGPLAQALEDADSGVRLDACASLGLLGNPRAIPMLLPVLEDPVWKTRINACWALVRLGAGDARLVATLEQLARDPEAVDWDLEADEMNQLPEPLPEEDEEGFAEPLPTPRVRELLEEARKLVANEFNLHPQ